MRPFLPAMREAAVALVKAELWCDREDAEQMLAALERGLL